MNCIPGGYVCFCFGSGLWFCWDFFFLSFFFPFKCCRFSGEEEAEEKGSSQVCSSILSVVPSGWVRSSLALSVCPRAAGEAASRRRSWQVALVLKQRGRAHPTN